MTLAGCSDFTGAFPKVRFQLGAGNTAPARYPGIVAADETEAVRAARAILEAGGSAGDAAVTLAFSLAVTLPSAAGIGGGGTCIVHDRQVEVLDFMTPASPQKARAGVPMLPRAMLALHAKYGHLPWAQVVAPAEALARFGTRVSPELARALAADGAVLVGDSTALQAFMTKERQTLQTGEVATHLDLAATLGRIRARVADFYDGPLAQEIEAAAAGAGGGITRADLRVTVPRWRRAETDGQVRLRVYASTGAATPSGPERATTSFVVADSKGNAIGCVLTMGQAFGLGVMAKGTGFLLAPASATAPELLPVRAASMGSRNILVFAAAGAGSASLTPASAAGASAADIVGRIPADARGNMLVCTRAVNARDSNDAGPSPAGAEDVTSPTCLVRSDPRGAGAATVFELKDPQ